MNIYIYIYISISTVYINVPNYLSDVFLMSRQVLNVHYRSPACHPKVLIPSPASGCSLMQDGLLANNIGGRRILAISIHIGGHIEIIT